MKKIVIIFIHFFLWLFLCEKTFSQDYIIEGVSKIYYYKTEANFFNNKIDTIASDEMIDYSYGKVKYKDRKTGKKVKFHLLRDSGFFAFRLEKIYTDAIQISPIYATQRGCKYYGVYAGGKRNFYAILYNTGMPSAMYDNKKYLKSIFYRTNLGGVFMCFSKNGLDFKQSLKEVDIANYLVDKPELLKKYQEEKKEATSYKWEKEFFMTQLKYLREYNND